MLSKKSYLLGLLLVLAFQFSETIAQNLSFTNIVAGRSYTYNSNATTCTGGACFCCSCPSSASGTTFGIKDGAAATTWVVTPFPGGTATLTKTYPTPGNYSMSHRSRSYSLAGTCSYNYGTEVVAGTISIEVVADLIATGTVPSAVCSNASTFSLYTFTNKTSGVAFFDNGVATSPNFDPSSKAAGNHVITATQTFTNGSTSINLGTINLTVLPVITSQPTGASLCANQSATLTVGFTGSTVGVQWQESTNGGGTWNNLADASVYSGVTTPSLSLSSLPGNFGTRLYRAVVANSCLSLNSSPATVSVFNTVTVSTHPNNSTLCQGANGSFIATGIAYNGAMNYDWQFSSDGGGSWNSLGATGTFTGGSYSGGTSSNLSISTISTEWNGRLIRCRLSDGCGVLVPTNAAAITVYGPVVVNTNPNNANVCFTGNASFTSSGTATNGSLVTTWQISIDGGTNFSNITNGGVYSGQGTSTLSLTGINTSFNNYRFRAVLSDGCGPATQAITAPATLNVFGTVPITTQPANRTICTGLNTTFVAAGTAQNGALTYQWQVSTNGGSTWGNVANGGVYAGVTTNTISLTGVNTTYNNYRYRVLVGDACGGVTQNTSNAAILTVNPATSITSNPVNVSGCSNGTVNFSAAATGTAPISYQWQESQDAGGTWINLSNIGNYSGTTTSNLSINSLPLTYSGRQYRAVATGACTSATTSAATLTLASGPTITNDPVGLTRCAGTSAAFTITATGASLSYVWQYSSTGLTGSYSNLPTSNNSTYTISSVTSGNGGFYRAVVTNSCGSSTSSGVQLIVQPITSIVTQPVNSSVCVGGNTSLSVTAGGTGAFTYQWQKDTGSGFANVGATTNSLSVTGAVSTDGGTYRVLVTGSCGSSVTSNSVTLTVNNIPTVPSTTNVSRCGNGSLSSTATSTSPSPTFKWYLSVSDVTPLSTGATHTISSLTSDQTRYVSVTSNGCEGPKREVEFDHIPLQPVVIGSAMSICVGVSEFSLDTDLQSDLTGQGSWSGTGVVGRKFFPNTAFIQNGNALGTFLITYTPPAGSPSTPNCYISNTRSISIIDAAGASSTLNLGPPFDICVSETELDLTGKPNISGGTWSGPGITGGLPIFRPNNAGIGTHTLTYTVNDGGCSATKDVVVTVKSLPEQPFISGTTNGCPGNLVRITGNVSGTETGLTYHWFKNGETASFFVGKNLDYTITVNESLFLRTQSSFGCFSNVTAVPITTPWNGGNFTVPKTTFQTGEGVKFTTDVTTGTAYSWTFGDGFNSTEINPGHYYYKPGVYTVKVIISSSAGCQLIIEKINLITITGDDIDVVTADNGSLIRNVETSVNVFPNPTFDKLKMESTNPIQSYRLATITGVTVIQGNNPEQAQELEVDQLAPGIYLLEVISGNKKMNYRIVKK